MTRSGSASLYAILEESPSEDDSVSSEGEGEGSGSPLLRACSAVVSATPVTPTPPLEETPMFHTTPMKPQRTTASTPLPEQLADHQEEQHRALHYDIGRRAVRHRGKLTGDWAAPKARLANLH
jgi:hypothetical protein